VGKNLEKSAGPCRALIVHLKFVDCTVFIKPDDLAVLTSNIDYRPDTRKQLVSTHRMRDYLGNVLGSALERFSPVSC